MVDIDNKPFPNPEGKINVLKRYLHVLALLQYIPEGEKAETWNARSLAYLLELEEEGRLKTPDDNLVSKYIKKFIEKELDISVFKKKGGLYSTLAEDLDINTQLMIARVYANFVIKDTSRDIILKKYIEAMPERALWSLARIYFASVERRMIQLSYVTASGKIIEQWKLCPYYFVFRNNNLYLAVWDPIQRKQIPLIADKISNLIILDKFKWDIPPVEELFKDSISAYISDGTSIEMKIRYSKKVKNTIENIISILDPQIKSEQNGEWFISTFNIIDYIYLCKQFVLYGSDVEIISPSHVRNDMIAMLKESLSVYEV